MPQIFADWQAEYAARGLPTFPINPVADGGRRKLPSVRHYDKIGLRGSQQLAMKFRDTNGIACMAGARRGTLRLTLIDIDARGAEADRLAADAQRLYGRSRFIVRTGGDGRHLYYRHNGEGRKIRPDPTCPIDVLGGGVVVLPPSLGAKQPYEVIEGYLDDLATLTAIRRAPTPDLLVQTNTPPMPDIPRIDLAGMLEGDGRNTTLFKIMCRNGHALPPTLDAFINFARERNMMCAEPMNDEEVVEVANSALRHRQNGTLRSGRHGGVWFPPTASPAKLVQDNLHLFGLLAWLKAMNGPDAEFWVADGLADILGWSDDRLSKARRNALDGGWIERIAPPSRGKPARYRWGPASKAEPAWRGGERGEGAY